MKRNNSKYTHGRTCVYNINYHIIWSTKYRNKWMTPAIEDEIKQILHSIAKENGFSIDHIEIGLDDHIHLLISAPPKLSVTVIVKCLKGTIPLDYLGNTLNLKNSIGKVRINTFGLQVILLNQLEPPIQKQLPNTLMINV